MLGNYLQQTTSADVIFQMHFFLGALSVNVFDSLCDSSVIQFDQTVQLSQTYKYEQNLYFSMYS